MTQMATKWPKETTNFEFNATYKHLDRTAPIYVALTRFGHLLAFFCILTQFNPRRTIQTADQPY